MAQGRFVKGSIPWNKGTKGKLPPKTEKWKKAMKKLRGRKVTWGDKIGLANSISQKGLKKPWVSKENKKRSGKNHYNWNGGISFEPYSIDWKKTLRISIRERDHYRCQLCGEPQGDRALSIHHIDYDKRNCNPNNLTTLCASCHTKTNFNRKYWQNYFNNLKTII